jgi:hypothetical protein
MIESPHHRGQRKQLWVVLSDLASQEGCDGSPYDEMMIASEYIEELENKINNLTSALKPFIENENRMMERIKEIDRMQDERDQEPVKEEPALEVGPNSHYNQPELHGEDHNGCCIICGRSQLSPDHATITDRCTYCGQKYRRF